jgi:hypothetical protein
MRVILKKLEGEKLLPVAASQVFESGDRIKIDFESNFDGYVYIVNVAPSGKTCVLFPFADEHNNQVRAGQRYTLPFSETSWFKFNDEKGDEVLQVYMSRQPIRDFDDTLKDAASRGQKAGCLSESVMSAARELAAGTRKPLDTLPAAGINTNARAVIGRQGGVRSRGVELYIGGNEEKGSVIAVAPEKTASQLKSEDMAFYEIRLRHQ